MSSKRETNHSSPIAKSPWRLWSDIQPERIIWSMKAVTPESASRPYLKLMVDLLNNLFFFFIFLSWTSVQIFLKIYWLFFLLKIFVFLYIVTCSQVFGTHQVIRLKLFNPSWKLANTSLKLKMLMSLLDHKVNIKIGIFHNTTVSIYLSPNV